MTTITDNTARVKLNGFTIVAAARPSHNPYVTVYAPNGTVALQTYHEDWYCDNVQELIAIGQAKVAELCDFYRLPPHHRALVAGHTADYIAKSFNISPETAEEWKGLAG
jgi:hypothetical protein